MQHEVNDRIVDYYDEQPSKAEQSHEVTIEVDSDVEPQNQLNAQQPNRSTHSKFFLSVGNM
jgi:hypothetical protein